MENINKSRLFLASCLALITTAMTFAIRARLETVFGPEGTMSILPAILIVAFLGLNIYMKKRDAIQIES